VRQLQHEDEGLFGPELQVRRKPAGGQWLIWLLLAAVAFVPSLRAQTAPPLDDAGFLAAVGRLRDATYSEKQQIVEQLAASGHHSAQAVLSAFLDDRLFYRNSDQRVFIVKSNDDSLTVLALVDPVSLADAGSASRDDLTRIGTNNALRKAIRIAVARFGLNSPDATVRLSSVDEILRSLDEGNIALLKQRDGVETNADVKEEIEVGLALAALDNGDRQARLDAIAALAGRLRPQVRNRLAALLQKNDDGSFVEPDTGVRRAAQSALTRIDREQEFYSAVQTLFFGLSVGSVLVLIAIGLAITFGVMGVINMAHGEFMMLGAYATYVVQQLMPNHIGISVIVALPVAFIVAGAAGILLERTIIRFLYGRPLETLLATFGVSLILQQLVRSIFSANNRAVQNPSWMSGTWQINPALAITYNRLTIVIFTAVVFAILVMVLKRTRLGLDIRAVSQNRSMAKAMGIRTAWVDAMTFGLGSGIAGLAGVALSQFTNVGPNLGQSYIVDSFMVVVFGGVGNLWGTLVGGLSMGVVNQLLEPYAGAVLAKIVVLVALILFIQRWPRGLFPQTGRAAESQ
jgi:urea transport system permease protein